MKLTRFQATIYASAYGAAVAHALRPIDAPHSLDGPSTPIKVAAGRIAHAIARAAVLEATFDEKHYPDGNESRADWCAAAVEALK